MSFINLIQQLPSLIESVPQEYETFVQNMYASRPRNYKIEFHMQFLGKGYQKYLPSYILAELFRILGQEHPNVIFFSCVMLRGQTFHSKDYSRVSKRNSYTYVLLSITVLKQRC